MNEYIRFVIDDIEYYYRYRDIRMLRKYTINTIEKGNILKHNVFEVNMYDGNQFNVTQEEFYCLLEGQDDVKSFGNL